MSNDGWRCTECGMINAPWRSFCNHELRKKEQEEEKGDKVTIRYLPADPLPGPPTFTPYDSGWPFWYTAYPNS